MDQTHFAVQRQVRADHRHASGMAHVYGYRICGVGCGALIPLDKQFHLGDYAFVASQKRPSLLHGFRTRVSNGIENHASYLALEVYRGRGREFQSYCGRMYRVNSTFKLFPPLSPTAKNPIIVRDLAVTLRLWLARSPPPHVTRGSTKGPKPTPPR